MPAIRNARQKSTGQASRQGSNIVTIAGKKIKTTEVFDTFWRFAAERKAIDDRRRAGLPPPWTEDPILSSLRFCNTFRVCDRASQYLITNVIETGSQDPSELTFRVILFNIFTNIKTWELLENEIGELTWAAYDQSTYANVLRSAKDDGVSLYTGSYQKPAPKLGHKEAFMNHLEFLEVLMNNGLQKQLAKCKYMADAFDVIAAMPGMGDFNAYQLLLDLSYTSVINFSESDFVVAGLGARSGIEKCFSSTLPLAGMLPQIIRWMFETQNEHFQRLGLTISGLGPENLPLQLCDIEHTLCEVDKYARIAHPKARGSGRPKTVAGRQYQPPVTEQPMTLHLPLAWSHPSRKIVRIKPGKHDKVTKRYVVDKIMDHRNDGGKREYRVRWAGYSAKDDTWEPASMFGKDAPLHIEEYHAALRKKGRTV
ncbi:chromo-domain-containing protein [Rickenella mellea]|uniref:Chromo-domain-containing protein n=1 Tax=Rickenella mellea TaxID=50990 RepID=A0A4Y7QG94_9AGAM|nr:chromo-domain-containing protein [Rickenella mellea]